jgi:hypothetical protein
MEAEQPPPPPPPSDARPWPPPPDPPKRKEPQRPIRPRPYSLVKLPAPNTYSVFLSLPAHHEEDEDMAPEDEDEDDDGGDEQQQESSSPSPSPSSSESSEESSDSSSEESSEESSDSSSSEEEEEEEEELDAANANAARAPRLLPAPWPSRPATPPLTDARWSQLLKELLRARGGGGGGGAGGIAPLIGPLAWIASTLSRGIDPWALFERVERGARALALADISGFTTSSSKSRRSGRDWMAHDFWRLRLALERRDRDGALGVLLGLALAADEEE